MNNSPPEYPGMSRRSLLRGVAGLGAMMGVSPQALPQSSLPKAGKLRQSVVAWCFSDYWSIEETCRHARDLGCESVELVGPEHWGVLRKYGLTCALSPIAVEGRPFVRGFNDPSYHSPLVEVTKEAIDRSHSFGCPNVIAFTGYSGNFSLEEGARNCIDGLKKVAGHAERKGVNVCLEMLNSRVSDHPHKGHPGYQGDHLDYCLEILRDVASPRIKLLFDVYHVQVMDGDVIRRIGECGEMIGHVHTAGNPGRGELDDSQELNYRPIMQALLDAGYQGFIGQEFIPTRDPKEGLREAVRLCSMP